MRFMNPGWLWLLLALPAIHLLLFLDENSRKKRLARFAKEAMWRSIVPEINHAARKRKGLVWLFTVAFALIALSRPQWGAHEEISKLNGLDVIFALDVSSSMDVEDVVPSRLKKAKHIIRSITERLSGDRVGLVAFAASSFVASPLTTDLSYFLDTMELTTPTTVKNQGTDLGLGLETARKALERAAEEASIGENNTQSSRIVILLSDGEDHEGGVTEAIKQYKQNGIRLYVFGVGTEKGGPVPIRDEAGSLRGYKRDRSGQPVVSSFKPSDLEKIAESAGGRYWNITANEAEVEDLAVEMNLMNRSEYAERRYLVREDRFQYPLAVAVLLLILEIGMPVRKVLIMLLLIYGTFINVAIAASPLNSLKAYSENGKGLGAYKDGKLDDAKKHFKDARTAAPESHELEFNEGIIKLHEGDLDEAARAFDRAAQNPGLAGKSKYNLGVTLGKKGDIHGAVKAYLESIDHARLNKDENLEADARKNMELLIQKRQQEQKNQQENKQDNKPDDKQKDDDQKNNQKNNGDQQDQKQKNEQQRYKETPRQEKKIFKSEKMSDQDAERVFAELKNRERELQMKLKKQHGNQQENGKNW
ncbi:MAG: VWA domain-containing protein [Bdellovibrionota bacterium]